MNARWITISAAIAIGSIGCALHRAGTSANAAPAPAGPVITRLIGQTGTITITASGHGPRYSVATLDRKMVLANLTIDELRQKDRNSYQQVNGATAWAGSETGALAGD